MNLPPPLMTSDPGSFARSTIIERKPVILRQVISENDYEPYIVEAILNFKDEIASKVIKPLLETTSDVEFWNLELEKYIGKTWLEVPWYFAETFFYRKLLEVVEYFQPGPNYLKNPFQKQKHRQIVGDVDTTSVGLDELRQIPQSQMLEVLVMSALWGNRKDLSNFTVKVKSQIGKNATWENENIIVNQIDSVKEFCSSHLQEIHFINDNVGSDLIGDMLLARFFLDSNLAKRIVFHLKNQPFFVSDAMPDDVELTLEAFNNQTQPLSRHLSIGFGNYLKTGAIKLSTDPFWTSCQMFSQMPGHLREIISKADLVILKGDVNYRRLIGDLHWSYTEKLESLTAYFPTNFLVLRTLKGEIMVGLADGTAESLLEEDPEWLINGKRGVIQLVIKEHY